MSILAASSPIPRYLRVAQLLRQRIEKGVWQPDERLPSLEALMEEFDIARVTARQAISLLAKDGLVEAARGKGTVVKAVHPQAKRLQVETSLADMARAYRDDKPTLTLVDESIRKPPQLAAEDAKLVSQYRHLRRVHARDEKLYCVISVFLDEEIFNLAPERFRHETVIPVMLDLKPVQIKRAKQTLRISSADIEASRLMEIPLNAPVAEVRRIFLNRSNQVIYFAEITYRADFIDFEMDLKV
jgi:GntR family transcriptional regulator